MTWFEPQDAQWQYVSLGLRRARWTVLAIWMTPLALGALALALLVSPWWWIGVAAVVIGAVWGAWLIHRQVTAHAWTEREEDLVVKRGRMFRTVTVVPYGRMQYVEVQSGPLERKQGIATVQLHTASPGTDASIHGVPQDEAARLRDRLTALGEAKLAGL